MTTRLARQVAQFHKEFGVSIRDVPTVLEKDEVALRLSLILEEAFELADALYGHLADFDIAKEIVANAIRNREPRVDLAEFADACGDLDYVVEGARLAFGIDGEPIAAEIHRCNMLKVGGERRDDGKILKPKTWEPPKISEELERQMREGGIGKMLKQKP